MLELVMVMFGVGMLGVVGVGLVVLNYLLKKREKQAIVDAIKNSIIPEIEAMTIRMLNSSMDMVVNKSVEITKKMTESMYD